MTLCANAACDWFATEHDEHPCGLMVERPGQPCRYCGREVLVSEEACPDCWVPIAEVQGEIMNDERCPICQCVTHVGPHGVGVCYPPDADESGQWSGECKMNDHEACDGTTPGWPCECLCHEGAQPTAPAHDHLGRNCPPSCPAHVHQPLDPEPWLGKFGDASRSAVQGGGYEGEALDFEPRPGYRQDRAAYGLGPERILRSVRGDQPQCAKCGREATVIIQDGGQEWYACDAHVTHQPTVRDVPTSGTYVAGPLGEAMRQTTQPTVQDHTNGSGA
jgi:hypothetical protein